MVLKRSVKRKRRNRRNRRNRRRRRSLQKGAGYSFNLDCNLPGGVPEVVTYNNCRTPQADLAPPADSQLAPPGQAQVEVVGVSNNNLAPVEQQAQAPQQVEQQAPQQAQQTGGRRRRRRRRRRSNRKSRKSLRRRSRKTRMRRRRRRTVRELRWAGAAAGMQLGGEQPGQPELLCHQTPHELELRRCRRARRLDVAARARRCRLRTLVGRTARAGAA